MNIHKQDIHSVFSKIFQVTGENYLVLTVMSAFSFDDSGILLDESDLWNAAGSALSNHDVLDMFMPKQKGEFLGAGKYFSPGGKPVRAGSVRISVGSKSKALHVFGDRRWIKKAGLVSGISDPQPMTEIEITYVNAFGGPGYRQNPLGKGTEDQSSEDSIPLPNIEYPDQLIGSPSDRPKPAGFGPLGLDWQQRADKLGTYDQKWLETRWPWFPEDMDWTYFNAAPGDQQIAGYFTGDETVVIENMHSERSAITTSLPKRRMRCFIRQGQKGDEVFKEVKTRLDTVWLFPEYETGAVIWRATVRVQDDDATDIHAAYVAHEFLIEPEKPIEYYRDIWFAGIAEEEAVEGPEVKPPEEEELAIIPKSMEPPASEAVTDPETEALIQELEKEVAATDAHLAAELKKLGFDPEQFMKDLPMMADLTIAAPSGPSADPSVLELEENLARQEAKLHEMIKELGFDPDKLMEVSKEIDQTEPPSAKELIKKMQESGINDPETEQYLLQMEREHAEAEKEVTALLEEEEKKEAELRKEEPPEKEEAKEVPEPEEALTREKVIKDYEEGKSFSGKDLSGLDLSDLDLRSIDLRGAILENIDFTGTNLTGAIFSGAVLAEASLLRATLTSAKMDGCNLNRVRGHQADMTHSDLRGADMTESDFSQGNFEKAYMDNAILENSKLEGARFEGVSAQWTVFTAAGLRKTDFRGADITRADFTDADIQEANFAETEAHSATFEGATGKFVNFEKADLRKSRADEGTRLERADFQKADLSEANWEGANLPSSTFPFATLTMTDLSSCSLPGCDFYRAVAKKAKFSRADLTDANMTSINLFRGDLTKAKLVRTDLKGSNLFEVEFLKAKVQKTNFQDANLKRTKLAGWVPK